MSDENNEFSEELVDESLIDDVIIQPESEILEDIKDVESVDEDGQDLESEIDEIIYDSGTSTTSIFIIISSWYSFENFLKNHIINEIPTNEINILIFPL